MKKVDDLISEYQTRLQKIYDNRTAVEHTFSGVLAEFVRDLDLPEYKEGRWWRVLYINDNGAWSIWIESSDKEECFREAKELKDAKQRYILQNLAVADATDRWMMVEEWDPR